MAGPTGTQDNVLSCHKCGASVYKEHLDTGLAGFYAGKLLCVYCLKELKPSPHATAEAPAAAAPAAAPVAAPAAAPVSGEELPALSLVDELEEVEPAPQRTSHGTTVGTAPPMPSEESTKLTRPLNKTGTGATRCRTFHCKLSDEAARHMDEQINAWCEKNPEIEIKFVSSTVGSWTGKHAEPNLIVTVLY